MPAPPRRREDIWESRRHYNSAVARGWESKSVEAQQAEAADKAARTQAPLSAKDAAAWRVRENLRLARQRVLQQIAGSPTPRHRELLENALSDLDEKLARLKS